MSIETEISSLTTAIRNLTDVLLASAAEALPDATVIRYCERPLAPTVTENITPAPEPKKTVKEEAAPVPEPAPAAPVAPVAAPAPAPAVSEDDLRVQIIELARPNMGDAAFKAFLGGKLAELQGAPCSISGTGKLPKIDAAHLPTLLAAINKQLGK